MNYRVNIPQDVQKEIKALSGHIRAQVLQKLIDFKTNPRPVGAKELRDKPNIYRVWVAGRWRIAYEVDDTDQRVDILRVRSKQNIDYESL